ncbi:ABC transporter permease [Labrys monachus]|uniref:Ribose/xylose/arabinose/galactoside ABC-type transport system permease subunit n=1 Tax=Labrys monachus TaxID=217067 RepID=A0ABU0FEN1_9HYPH|nr:ABC transporter permease [Labrys monachus]MDQ0392777.1 ribose/xylose/arabinose/galactoside ABC-type transport system permease subunit [Labrys monachus]
MQPEQAGISSTDLASAAPAKRRFEVKEILLRYALVLVLFVFVIVLGLSNASFFTLSNFNVVLLQVSTNALLATGATYVILTGGIDLSVGSVVGMSGVAAAMVAQRDGVPWTVAAVATGVLAGGAIGLLNGLLVAVARVPAFVATLGTMTIALGIAYVLSDGQPISGLSDAFLAVSDQLYGFPIPVILMVLAVIVSWLHLSRTRVGLHIYAAGGNPQAARVAGVNLRAILVLVYTISGLLAGLAGVVLASRATAGIATTGTGYELNAIAAAVIGGISLMGGRGSIFGTVFGFMIIGVLDNGLNILNVSPFYQLIIKGVIIIGAVFIDSTLNRKDD